MKNIGQSKDNEKFNHFWSNTSNDLNHLNHLKKCIKKTGIHLTIGGKLKKWMFKETHTISKKRTLI
jgi:hypothetical protein